MPPGVCRLKSCIVAHNATCPHLSREIPATLSKHTDLMTDAAGCCLILLVFVS
jgi:hypothetical protein